MVNKISIGCLIAVIALLVAIPQAFPPVWTSFLFFCFIYASLAEIWNLQGGFTGIINLGTHGFIGFAAYIMAIAITFWGLPVWASLLIAGAATTLLALVVSPLIFKMRGLYLGMGTLVLALAVYSWFVQWSYTYAGRGFYIAANVLPVSLYYMALILLIASVTIVWLIKRSRIGLMLIAVRDNERAAQDCGVDVFQVKLYCYLISAFMTALIGGTFYLFGSYLRPITAFTFTWVLLPIAATVIGGMGTIGGPLIGGFLTATLNQYVLARFPGLSQIVYGALIIIILLLVPGGIISKIKLRLPTPKTASKKVETVK
ncbi:MAG: branched-chain amino acid ABC transporter permease [Candidatus Bathyarchaeia archaeon]|nr:branched-chain amino acid ABC transporter permease [Candidatus Bathyarchaeota archaeon]